MNEQSFYPPKQDFCKNHHDVPSGYFLPTQPWIKYCKICALNVALCGKKIEKIYSSHELQRKLTIESIAIEMKECLEQVQENQFCYGKLLQMFDENARIMAQKIKQINNALRELTNSKKQLEQLFIQQIQNKVATYSQRQNSLFMSTIDIKKELESIESRFTSFIQSENEGEFERCEEKWNGIIVNFKKQMIKQEQYSQIRNNMCEAVQNFYYQYQNLTKFTFLPSKKQQTLVTEHQFDYTLTPLTTNNLHNEPQPQQGKLFVRTKNHLKLKCNKRSEKSETCATKISSKRQSCASYENW